MVNDLWGTIDNASITLSKPAIKDRQSLNVYTLLLHARQGHDHQGPVAKSMHCHQPPAEPQAKRKIPWASMSQPRGQSKQSPLGRGMSCALTQAITTWARHELCTHQTTCNSHKRSA